MGVVITFVEVTRRKQVEEELRRAKLQAEKIIDALHEPLLVLAPDLRVKSANPAFYRYFHVNPEETEGRLIFALGNGQWNVPALRNLLEGVLPQSEAFDDFEVDHDFEDIGRRVVVLNARRLSDLDLIVIGIHDITDRKFAEEEARSRQQRLTREVSALDRLNQMSLAVMMTRNVETALDEILKAAMDLLGADLGNVRLYDSASGRLRLVVQHGFDPDFVQQFALVDPHDRTAYGRAFTSNKRIVVEDVDKDETYARDREIAARIGYRAVQSTPLLSNTNDVIGVLSTYFRLPRTISKVEEQLIDLLARQANALIQRLSVENALKQLTETLEQRIDSATQEIRANEERVRELASRLTMAEHQERDRLAQILHDDLQQLLYSIRLRFAFLREGIESGDGDAQLESIAKAEAWVDEAIQTTQQLAVDLSPQVLRNEGLIKALRWLVAQMAQLHGLRIGVVADMKAMLPKSADILLFQSVRELLFNVVKHAGTDRATVEVSETDGMLQISVADEGKGFDVADMSSHEGFGVLSIQHRISLLGGEMKIESAPGKGTKATIELPTHAIGRSGEA